MTELVPNNLPAHLQGMGAIGTEGMAEFLRPPRLVVVQALSTKLRDAGFNEGAVVAVPGNILVADVKTENIRNRDVPTKEGLPFEVVPLFFYPEWVVWNPRETRGSLKSIRARTFDKKSEIARKAKDPDQRMAPCPELPEKDGKALKIRYVEHLNFVVLIRSIDELRAMPMVLSFSRAEHSSGSQWLTLIHMKKAPICSAVYQLSTKARTNEHGTWCGIDAVNATPSWVEDEAEFKVYLQMHEELSAAHKGDRLVTDYDEEESEPDASGETSF